MVVLSFVAALLAVLHGGAASTCVADALPVVSGRRCRRGRLKPPTSLAASQAGGIQIDQAEEASQKRILNREFATIALPAFFQLAAEPLAGLVDTAYLGRLGPSVLGGAGVAISAQYAVSKLYNDPLLRTSISLVASQDGRSRRQQGGEASDESNRNSLSIAVSSALLLAFTVGAIQLLLYFTFAGQILKGMGVGPESPMHHSAYSYLRVRALGTPAATLWLVTNGVFRGLGDTSTPLKYSILFTCLNAVLDPFFIFSLKFGASGAAAGTAIAQYTALIPLMISLHRKVGVDIFGQLKDLGGTLKEYVKAGSYVFLRTIGKVLAYSVCARQAALLGSVAAAAYNLTFQLGFATTQLCESVAVAVQTLLAREIASGKDEVDGEKRVMAARKVRHLINGSIFVGGLVAGGLSFITHLQKDSVLRGLTTDLSIREASGGVFSAVLVTQVLKGLAYPCNGVVMVRVSSIVCVCKLFCTDPHNQKPLGGARLEVHHVGDVAGKHRLRWNGPNMGQGRNRHFGQDMVGLSGFHGYTGGHKHPEGSIEDRSLEATEM